MGRLLFNDKSCKNCLVILACSLCCFGLFSHFAFALNINIDAENLESISHYRALPAHLSEDKQKSFVRHSVQDKQGYIWIGSNNGIQRYNGYKLEDFSLEKNNAINGGQIPYLFVDGNQDLWVGDMGLYKFDYQSHEFNYVDIGANQRVNGIVEDSSGSLWIAGTNIDLIHLDPISREVIGSYNLLSLGLSSDIVHSLAYEKSQDYLWMATDDGLVAFDLTSKSLVKVITPFNGIFSTIIIRDIGIDESRSHLWLGTTRGLLQLNTKTLEYVIHSIENGAVGLPTNDVSTVYIDSEDNVWLGLEKEGICLYQHIKSVFICHRSAVDVLGRLPFATIEDISEDSSGSLWISMNNYGVYRMTPRLEIFKRLHDEITQSSNDYFPHTFDAVVRDNHDMWMGTDGGGINIFNYKTGVFQNLRNDPLNKSSISSNAVISIAEDNQGFIWAGTWAGGVNKINPDTFEAIKFEHDPNQSKDQTLAGNNIFFVLPDPNGGVWLSVWGFGLQYFDDENGSFTSYIHKVRGGKSKIANSEITHMQRFDNKIYIAGESALEYFDSATKQFVTLLNFENNRMFFVLVESHEEIWLGTVNGLIRFNSLTNEIKTYTVTDGLSDNVINYLYKDEFARLWIATNKGLSILDTNNEQISTFYERDGLLGDALSTHGEFTRVGDDLYIPNKRGVNIVNIKDIAENTLIPTTYLTQLTFSNPNKGSALNINPNIPSDLTRNLALNHEFKNLTVKFTALSYIYPEHNIFKYRLKGWQQEFTYTKASERLAKFDNLPPGFYQFEVYSANSNEVWEDTGAIFSFEILSPWWSSWWARLLFALLAIALAYGFIQWRISKVKSRERELAEKVEEKTQQLKEYASELEYTSDSLAKLNAELEQRVEARTEELQVEVNERKVAESKLFHLAFHDSLTGLPNREWLIKRLNSLISKNNSGKCEPFGLMFLDGDRFKQINDTHGHTIGDELLIASGMRLSKLLSENQHAARLGGDEFTVIAENIENTTTLEALGKSIIEAFEKPFIFDKTTIHFRMSVGLVLCDESYTTVTGALRDADIAMYNAKQAGKGTFKTFDKEMRKVTLALSQLENDLRVAVNKQEFYLVYQPLLDTKSNRISGCEALIRWQHPTRGNVPPDVFIPMAEETGLIIDIGKWVLKTACEQLKQWQLFDCLDDFSISINLSSNQLRGNEFLDTIDEVLSETGISGKYLKLELTESSLIENNQHIQNLLEDIIKRDIELAIDDFGTGYSSLAYLNQLPVQHIKVDRRFIDAIDNTPDGQINNDALEVVRATVNLGKSLRMKVTAEGIETVCQLEELNKLGVDYAQGYYISKPLHKDKVIDFIIRDPLQFEAQHIPPNPLSRYKEDTSKKLKRLTKK